MRILHICCIAPPDLGGMGQVAHEIVRVQRERGDDAVLVAPKRRVQDGQKDESWVIRLPVLFRWGNASIVRGLDSLIRNTDVVHLHYPFFGTAEAVAQSCLVHRKPLFTTFHMDATASFPMSLVFSAFRFASQPAILLASQRLFVSSMDYAVHSSAASFLKGHPDRVIENPFGVDPMFTPGQGDRARFGIPNNVFVVGFTASMDHAHRFKGIEVLLDALTMLPGVHALFIGDGDRRRVYESWAKDKHILDRCHFAGRLSREDLPIAYRTMDVFAFPSIGKAEAFGLVAAEALASGVPVIASDLAGVRTVVRHDETGLIIPCRDAKILATSIEHLQTNVDLRKRFSEHAAKDARIRFDWNRHVDVLMKAYLRKT
jgi:glycosyltransferase involved in cell wall biosynthesis